MQLETAFNDLSIETNFLQFRLGRICKIRPAVFFIAAFGRYFTSAMKAKEVPSGDLGVKGILHILNILFQTYVHEKQLCFITFKTWHLPHSSYYSALHAASSRPFCVR